MVRFFVTFVLLLTVLFGAELTPWAQTYFVVPWTTALATISAWLASVNDPNIATTGNVIRSTANGVGPSPTIDLAFSVTALMPAPWRDRLVGLAAGIVAVQWLNIVRVISLFYLGQWNMQVFEWAHFYVWQALIMLDVLIVWLVWVRLLPRDGGASRRPGGPPGGSPAPVSA